MAVTACHAAGGGGVGEATVGDEAAGAGGFATAFDAVGGGEEQTSLASLL